MSVSREGEILVDEDTHSQAEGYFEFKTLEPVMVKGKVNPIKIFSVQDTIADPSKVHRLYGLQSKMIGRDVEMRILEDAVERLIEGKGSLITICGTAGTGKSRLIYEFRKKISHQKQINWYDASAFPYTENTSYWPLIDLLRKTFRVEEYDTHQQVREKIESGVKLILGKETKAIPYIGSLFSLEYPEVKNISPEFYKSKLFETMIAIVRSLINERPIVICAEDLHWADPSFLELIRKLLCEIYGPILFICIFRPVLTLFTTIEITSYKLFHQEIRLHDLSSSESKKMVESLLLTDNAPKALLQFVRNNVEGNPFYIEELINSLIMSDTLIKTNEGWEILDELSKSNIPTTINGVLSGRIERLPKETRRILQEASVIGRTFLYDILKQISSVTNNIEKNLIILERLDLIKAKSLGPDLEYEFKHALTQEIVYNGLLKKERKVIHAKIGQVMEILFKERLTEFCEILAYHFKTANIEKKAITYLVKSGEKCLKIYSLKESDKYFNEAFLLITNKSQPFLEDKELLIDLIIRWAYVFYYNGKVNGWIDLFQRHKRIADSISISENVGMFYAWMGFAYLGNDNKKSLKYLDNALRIGLKIQSQRIECYAKTWLTFTYADLGLLNRAEIIGIMAHKLAKKIESDPYLYFKSLGGMGIVYWSKGDPRRLEKIGKSLLRYGRQYSNIRSQTMGYMSIAGKYLLIGDYPNQIKYFQKAIAVSQDPFYANISKTFLCLGFILNGQIDQVKLVLPGVESYCSKNETLWIGTLVDVLKGIVIISDGQIRSGIAIIEKALIDFQQGGRKYHTALTEQILGKIYLEIIQRDKPMSPFILLKNIGFLIKTVPVASKKAEYHIKRAIRISKDINAKGLLGQAYLDLGILYKNRNDSAKSEKYLKKSIEILHNLKADKLLEKSVLLLKSI
jgi:tetratricopeptide (TPR) repeat protein